MTGQRDLLIDSHILIWSLYQSDKLPARYKPILESDDRTWISVATIWEVEIKRVSGKLPLPASIWEQASAVGHRVLVIKPEHAMLAANLPPHHADPFDRMLAAQAIVEGMTILTADDAIRRYEVAVA